MMLAFLSHIPFTSAWTEVLGDLGLIGAVAGLYHHVECNEEACHRLGRFRHGHLKLCHVHHPRVPSDGKVNAEHIRRALDKPPGGLAATPPIAPSPGGTHTERGTP